MHSSSNVQMKTFSFSPDWVIYSDEDIVIANKPSGLLSVPGRGPDKQECLVSHLAKGFPDIRIVHRLDMDTSGLMVLANTAEAHRNLSRQFQDRLTEKTYHAVCAGRPTQTSGIINLPMRCDWERRPLQKIDFLLGKHASTQWQIQQQFSDRFLVELTPITGRSHQLRLHMQSLGHPILGDNLYADPISLCMADRLLLHAYSLCFQHPTTHEKLCFSQVAEFESYC